MRSSLANSQGSCETPQSPQTNSVRLNTKFTSTFWCELHKLMGTKLLMSTVFHPQMDGTTEWENHSIGQILRMVIHDDQRNWAAKCPMVEFMLNSNISATTGFAPFKLNQGYRPQIGMPLVFDTMFKGVKQFTLQAKRDLMAAHDAIIANHIQQMFHTNKNVRFLHLTNFLTIHQKNLDQIYIISGVLSDRYERYSKEYSCLSNYGHTHACDKYYTNCTYSII